jgi:hypothetical protein
VDQGVLLEEIHARPIIEIAHHDDARFRVVLQALVERHARAHQLGGDAPPLRTAWAMNCGCATPLSQSGRHRIIP